MDTIIKELFYTGKGILAADESIASANKRLGAIGVKANEEMRRLYRDLFFDSGGFEKYLSGIILHDETIHQRSKKEVSYVDLLLSKGIIPGIKVDQGTVDLALFPGEKITEGLDGLPKRLDEYRKLGLQFAKWRAVITIGSRIPTNEAIVANAFVLARYAGICIESGMVPIIEPEVLMTGDHGLVQTEEVTTGTLLEVFQQMKRYRVDLSKLILKTNMVVSGQDSGEAYDPKEVAEATVRVLLNSVPTEVPGVVFLSGGQTSDQASKNLNAIAQHEPLPWEITFSYARAIQGPALKVWQGKPENVDAARAEFIRQLEIEVKAEQGQL